MRVIKIRAKAIEPLVSDSQWIDGFGVHEPERVDEVREAWLYTESGVYQVDPETVGQYTGLKDKNGVQIYEGDIIDVQDESFPFVKNWKGIVKMREGSYLIENFEGTDGEYLFDELRENEVIGNIYTNPELLATYTPILNYWREPQ